jgi:hypothetical protein
MMINILVFLLLTVEVRESREVLVVESIFTLADVIQGYVGGWRLLGAALGDRHWPDDRQSTPT